jgi:hypothetical protein
MTARQMFFTDSGEVSPHDIEVKGLPRDASVCHSLKGKVHTPPSSAAIGMFSNLFHCMF